MFPILKRFFPNITGSEYFGVKYSPGELVDFNGQSIRHEDLTRISFPDTSLDLVITQGVFEHVYDYMQSFKECARVLSSGGTLLFNIPPPLNQKESVVRAAILPNGEIKHILPPEIHLNPMDKEGAICYHNFGWDILDSLREAGFDAAFAHLYWGPWEGHLGGPKVIFSARKR